MFAVDSPIRRFAKRRRAAGKITTQRSVWSQHHLRLCRRVFVCGVKPISSSIYRVYLCVRSSRRRLRIVRIVAYTCNGTPTIRLAVFSSPGLLAGARWRLLLLRARAFGGVYKPHPVSNLFTAYNRLWMRSLFFVAECPRRLASLTCARVRVRCQRLGNACAATVVDISGSLRRHLLKGDTHEPFFRSATLAGVAVDSSPLAAFGLN